MHYTEHDDDRMIRVRASEWDRLEDRCKELEAELLTAQEGIEAWKAENAKTCARIRELEASIADHFTNEHLAGDGPEIDRWKRKVKELEADNEQMRPYFIKRDSETGSDRIRELESEVNRLQELDRQHDEETTRRIRELEAELAAFRKRPEYLHGYDDGKDSQEEELRNVKDCNELLNENLTKAKADNARLREALEYTLQCWEGSMNCSPEDVMEWVKKARAELKEGE